MKRKVRCFICIMLPLVMMAACSEKKAVESTGSVPLSVFQQEITSPSPLPTMKVNEKATMDVTVKNTGNEAWPNKGSDEKGTNIVALGFYWHDSAGKKIDEGQGVSLLPNVLASGSSISFKVTIHAPVKPGNYKLYFSMFQNNVAWFNDKGATPLVVNVKVKK
jgi:hypothetical protein